MCRSGSLGSLGSGFAGKATLLRASHSTRGQAEPDERGHALDRRLCLGEEEPLPESIKQMREIMGQFDGTALGYPRAASCGLEQVSTVQDDQIRHQCDPRPSSAV
jgi:hypothetical protein